MISDMLAQQEMEAEVMATIQTFMRFWEQRGVEAIDGFFAYVAEDFGGFGTGQGEYYADRDTFRAHTEQENEQTSYAITFSAPWMKVRVVHPALALAEGEFKIDVHKDVETYVLRPRCSLVFERQEERWMLLHFHFSLPNAMQNEGDSLLELFKARNRELEREVARRTAELEQSLADLQSAQARLIHQEKMASLGALTAGIAHEIKNPLNFVNNFAVLSRDLARELVQELEAEADPEAVRAIVSDLAMNSEKIEAHGRRADRIVRSMLEHARGSSGERRTVDLNALVAEHVDLAWHGERARTGRSDVRITKDLDAEVGQVEVVQQEIGRLTVYD
jgi:signal transduction histidine kinase